MCPSNARRSFLWKQSLKRSREKLKHSDKVALGSRGAGGRLLVGLGHVVARQEPKGRAPRVPAALWGFPRRDIKCSLADPWPVPPRPLQRKKKAKGARAGEGRGEAPSLTGGPADTGVGPAPSGRCGEGLSVSSKKRKGYTVMLEARLWRWSAVANAAGAPAWPL